VFSMANAALSSKSHAAPNFRARCTLRLHIWDWAYAREMLLPMSIGVLALVLALAGNFVYWAINSIINQGMSAAPVVRLFFLAAPGFAVQGIPAGVILAVCLVLNRAVRDNEFIALRVAGASVPRILTPFLAMAFLASCASWILVEKIIPRTNDMANKTLLSLMSRAATPLMQSDKYFRVGNYYFYVRDVLTQTHELRDVMVYERAGTGPMATFAVTPFPTVYIAKSAKENPKVANQWILRDVMIHFYDDKGALRLETHEDKITINLGRAISTYWAEDKEPFSMTSDELQQRINDLSAAAFDQTKVNIMRVDYYRRFSLPFACFVMALLAAPLALRFAKHGSFAGLVLAFALAFFWQGFDGWFRALGIAYPNQFPPILAAWLTNASFLLVGSALLWRER
jgi:lipopolysaccharide export LptBFGC system permease protein LptF